MIEAGRASSIASAGLSRLLCVERGSFEVVMKLILISAGRSGAEVVLGERPEITRLRVSLIPIFKVIAEMPSKKVDHIEVANSKSISQFVSEYLPSKSVPFLRRSAASDTSQSSASRFSS